MNCYPVPRGTRNHPSSSHHPSPGIGGRSFGWLGAPVGSGNRVKRCLSEGAAPRTF